MLNALRTPDECFDELPDFPFISHYIDQLDEFGGLRLHYLDEGPETADEIYLCLHGEPTWSYLYRHMLPVFTRAGGRVVVPDLFGFGRSDKPGDPGAYHFDFHFLRWFPIMPTPPGPGSPVMPADGGVNPGRGDRSWPSVCRIRCWVRR